MVAQKGFTPVFILLLILVIAGIFYFLNLPKPKTLTENIRPASTVSLFPYKAPKIAKNQSYRIVIVGDSIVNSLGPNANTLRLDLIGLYPDSEFVTYNYGYPSTNIFSLYPRLTEQTMNDTTENPAILKQGFELLIIESFGYNPLAQFSLEVGLKKQEEELERSVRLILTEKPNVALAFLTPIAPDPVNFAKSTIDLSPKVRKEWVEERIAYIDNHRKFAQERGIPVIDVYPLSLKPNGEVDTKYISQDDFIHPSKEGIELISRTIADYIFSNKIFPE